MFLAPRSPKRCTATGVLLGAALLLLPPSARGETTWLDNRGPVPALHADPKEPRTAVGWFPADLHLGVSVGGRFSLVEGDAPDGAWAVAVEGGVTLDFGIDGSFLPLETVDGTFGIRGEGARGLARAVLRLRHLSAHQADGDSTVAFRASAVSREFWSLEIGAAPPDFYAYMRAGLSWHAVPAENAPNFALGIEWVPLGPSWRPVAALYWGNDAAGGQRSLWSTFAGVETGRTQPIRVGLRWFHGPGPSAQVTERIVDRWGLEFQLSP